MTRHHDGRKPHPAAPRRAFHERALITVALLAAGWLGLPTAPARALPGSLELARHIVVVPPGRRVEVRGERNHQQRLARRLPATWSADQKAAAARYGFPVYRLRELSAGALTETWSYPAADLQLVFDAAGRLIDLRRD